MDSSSYDNEEDDYRIPPDTMLILQEFLREKELREKAEQAGEPDGTVFEEDWQLSQFWYNTSTKEKLTSVVSHFGKHAENQSNDLRVALLSSPSLYHHIKKVNEKVTLFEFDNRFASIGPDFHPFDYKRAIEDNYFDDFRKSFDVIIADPPFLSEECIEKVGMIVRKIGKPDAKVVLCSGYAVRDWAKKFLNLVMCEFEPEHERNLGNKFASYANFNLDEILAEKK